MKQKIALVTGGSRGIGAAICKKLAKDGAIVIVNYFSNKEEADKVVAEIKNDGGHAIALQGDATKIESMKNLINKANETLGDIDILVSNAHINFPIAPIEFLSWNDFSNKVNNELYAAFNSTQLVIEKMKANKYGKIVFISSALSKSPAPAFAAHGVAKAALNTFAEYLAQEVGVHGITVNIVGPGFTETDATKDLPSEIKMQNAQMASLKKVATPNDIANGVSFLVSDLAGHITGSYMPITGGA